MSVRANIGIRVNDGYSSRIVTAHASRVQWRSTAPGGYATGKVRLVVPRNTFRDLGPADTVCIYCGATGRTLFEGQINNPGVSDGPAGQAYDLVIDGTQALAGDSSQPLYYVDRDTSTWEKESLVLPSSTTDVGKWPADPSVSRIRTLFASGNVVGPGDFSGSAYYRFDGSGMRPGAILLRGLQSGTIDTGYQDWVVTESGVFSVHAMTTTGTDFTLWAGEGGWPDADVLLAVKLVRVGGATNVVGEDVTYSDWVGPIVLGRRVDRNGTDLQGVAGLRSPSDVLSHEVVEDLLGRVLTMCDPVLSTIETGTYPIEQLMYDSATARQVLDDLALWEPGFLWEMLDRTPRGVRFNYREWPTTVRYEFSTADDYQAPGSDVDLCNRVAVKWTDAAGVPQVTIVTADVPQLGGDPLDPGFTGRVRDADAYTLAEGLGSETNAARIGQQILADKASPPKAGKVVVRRRIMDRMRGHLVWPWEIEAGYLARVRETGDLLRMTEVDYNDEPDPATTVTLGTPVMSMEQRVAQIQRGVQAIGARVS